MLTTPGSLTRLCRGDTRAIQLKLDEILRGTESARTQLVKPERLSDEELTQIEQEIIELREQEDES